MSSLAEDFNLFTILGLDPATESPAAILECIETSRKAWTRARVDGAKREAAARNLSLVAELRRVATDPVLVAAHAEEAKNERVAEKARATQTLTEAAAMLGEDLTEETIVRLVRSVAGVMSASEARTILENARRQHASAKPERKRLRFMDSSLMRQINDGLEAAGSDSLYDFLERPRNTGKEELLSRAREVTEEARRHKDGLRQSLGGHCLDVFGESDKRESYDRTIAAGPIEGRLMNLTKASVAKLDQLHLEQLVKHAVKDGVDASMAEDLVVGLAVARGFQLPRQRVDITPPLVCGHCMFAAPADGIKCAGCGELLKQPCHGCGEPVPTQDRCCSGCGFEQGNVIYLRRLLADAKRLELAGQTEEARGVVDRVLGVWPGWSDAEKIRSRIQAALDAKSEGERRRIEAKKAEAEAEQLRAAAIAKAAQATIDKDEAERAANQRRDAEAKSRRQAAAQRALKEERLKRERRDRELADQRRREREAQAATIRLAKEKSQAETAARRERATESLRECEKLAAKRHWNGVQAQLRSVSTDVALLKLSDRARLRTLTGSTKAALERCQARCEEAKTHERNGRRDRAIEHYLGALELCADDAVSTDALHRLPPPPPSQLKTRVMKQHVVLTWTPVKEPGSVRYCVARRVMGRGGRFKEQSLADGLADCVHLDAEAPLAPVTFYTVRSVRGGVRSAEVVLSSPCIRVRDVQPRYERGHGTIHLAWDPVPGASGIEVLRAEGQVPESAEDAQWIQSKTTGFSDSGLNNSVAYGYRIVVVFDDPTRPGHRLRSEGATLMVLPSVSKSSRHPRAKRLLAGGNRSQLMQLIPPSAWVAVVAVLAALAWLAWGYLGEGRERGLAPAHVESDH